MSFWDIIDKNFIKIFKNISLLKSPSSLWRGIFTVGFGTAIAQLINIISTPILTRLYTPSDFGIFALFGSIIAILVVAASLRYEFAIPLPHEDTDAANLMALCVILLAGAFVILLLIVMLFGNFIIAFLHYERMEPYIWLTIAGFLGVGLYNILNYWAIRKREYIRITKTRINQSLSGSIAKITLGLIGFGPLGLVIGDILSQVSGISTFLRQIWKNDMRDFQNIHREKIIATGKKYKKFPFFSFPSSILNVITLQLPIFMLSTMFDLKVVGYYSLANMVLVFPTSFIASSMAQVFFGEVAKLIHENPEKIKNMYISTTKQLLIFGAPIILGIAIIAPLVFPFIFGGIWKEAGWYCIPLTLLAISSFTISSTSNLATYGFNHWQLGWDIIRISGVSLGFFIAFILNFSPITTLLLYGLILTFMYIVLFCMNIRSIEKISRVP